ncbi:MAG TPA: RcpC/CpaB family pilus assembly protein, partial [Acidimicrobiales bacterium]|nr:RcpC/CpaB family pilus assembly protein [Acidimicrobiales bacterium]
GVAGLPVPGDKVDILVTVGTAENFLLQNVPVLAIGQTSAATAAASGSQSATTTAATSSSSSGLFTFAVRPSDAARIALAEQQSMGLYLALVPAANPVVSVPGVDQGSILNGPQASG